MATEADRQDVLVLVRRLLRIHALAHECAARLCRCLESSEAPASSILQNLLGTAAPDPPRPLVDATAMTVAWQGAHCLLGPSIQLGLMDRLARHPGRWVTYDRLKTEVWRQSVLSDGAIKVAVLRLRRQLRTGGMADLADCIQIRGRRCALVLDRLHGEAADVTHL